MVYVSPMRKYMAGILLLGGFLTACAPTVTSAPAFDSSKVTQEINAYSPDVEFLDSENTYIVVEDATTGMIQQKLDNLTPGITYKATFSRFNSPPKSLSFIVESGKKTSIQIPKLEVIDASLSDGATPISNTTNSSVNQVFNSQISGLAFNNYNINNYYYLVNLNGQVLTSIYKIPAGSYGIYGIRGGYASDTLQLKIESSFISTFSTPSMTEFSQQVIARALREYNASNPSTGGGYSSGGYSGGGTVPVKGYYRSNGTYVAPYFRSAPRRR